MTTIVRTRESAAFLALVPSLLGCTPESSVVLVPFVGSRSRGAMRVDLPPADEVESAAATLVGLLCRIPEADGVAIVVFTDVRDDAGAFAKPPHAALVEALTSRAHACGVAIKDALYQGATAWGSYLDRRPPEPLSGLTVPPAVAIRAGRPARNQRSGARLPRRDAVRAARIAGELETVREAAADAAPVPFGDLTGPTGFRGLALLLDQALEKPDDVCLAHVAWCLSRAGHRSAAAIQWATSADRCIDALLRLARAVAEGDPVRVDAAHDEFFDPLFGIAPQPEAGRLEAALAVCRTIAAHTDDDARAGALALCGWLSWALGRSTHAAVYARRALRLDPAVDLADLVRALTDRGQLPDWAFARPTSPAGTGSSRGSRVP